MTNKFQKNETTKKFPLPWGRPPRQWRERREGAGHKNQQHKISPLQEFLALANARTKILPSLSASLTSLPPNGCCGRERILTKSYLSSPEERKERAAFTLAEVLITLGVIGVVAAMTLPTLIQNHRDKQTVIKLKKAVNVVANAYNMAVAELGEVKHWDNVDYQYTGDDGSDATMTTKSVDPIIDKLQILKDCGHEAKGCFEQRYKNIRYNVRERDFENLSYYRKVILNDGTLLAAQSWGGSSQIEVWVDVNGNKAPNVVGEDMFMFIISKGAAIKYYMIDELKSINSVTLKTVNPYPFAAWVMQFENLDYLHCEGLSWNGKHKCNE